MVIAGLIADAPVEIEDIECISISYPNFSQDLQKLDMASFEPTLHCNAYNRDRSMKRLIAITDLLERGKVMVARLL